MKIGLYFGSFNPVHVGHLIIANHILNNSNIQKIWFVVSPHNPFKNEKSLLNEYDRLHMVDLAIKDNPDFKSSNIEFSLTKPSYTINTLTVLKDKYPQFDFSIIMGGDSFQNIKNWKNADQILKNYEIIVYERPGFNIDNTLGNIQNLKAPLLDISSTHIRNQVKLGNNIRYLVPDQVAQYIEYNNYYR
jgi:nicotinate-nucleotide adenylyltransferase